MRKPWSSNEIFKVFKKSGNGSKIWGNGPKIFEETNQQNVIFKVFEKSGNGSKKWGNGPKILGIPSKILGNPSKMFE